MDRIYYEVMGIKIDGISVSGLIKCEVKADYPLQQKFCSCEGQFWDGKMGACCDPGKRVKN